MGKLSLVLLPCCCSKKLLFSLNTCKRSAFLLSKGRGSLGVHVGLSWIVLSVTEDALKNSYLREVTLLVLSVSEVLGLDASSNPGIQGQGR